MLFKLFMKYRSLQTLGNAGSTAVSPDVGLDGCRTGHTATSQL